MACSEAFKEPKSAKTGGKSWIIEREIEISLNSGISENSQKSNQKRERKRWEKARNGLKEPMAKSRAARECGGSRDGRQTNEAEEQQIMNENDDNSQRKTGFRTEIRAFQLKITENQSISVNYPEKSAKNYQFSAFSAPRTSKCCVAIQ